MKRETPPAPGFEPFLRRGKWLLPALLIGAAVSMLLDLDQFRLVTIFGLTLFVAGALVSTPWAARLGVPSTARSAMAVAGFCVFVLGAPQLYLQGFGVTSSNPVVVVDSRPAKTVFKRNASWARSASRNL